MILSIVIPTYNEEKYLPLLLLSIKRQIFNKEYEIIVADNHSTDATRKIARGFGARVVEGGMPGPGRNKGAQVATGKYILFLDADVSLDNIYYLHNSLLEFESKKLDCATCRIAPISNLKRDVIIHEAYNIALVLLSKIAPIAPGFCIWVKRDIHNLIQGFDEEIKLAEDTDYVSRISKIAKFDVLMNYKVPTSVRRLERDGRLNICVKYLLAGMYIPIFGKIKTDIFKYTFGHKD